MVAATRAVLGLRAHSGWAAAVVLAGTPDSPEVVDRRRIELADPRLRGSEQPYHAAEGLGVKEAAALLKRYSDSALRLAERGLGDAIAEVRRRGHEIVGCGILLGSGREGSSLATILSSHPLIHTADGNHFRDALRRASEGYGLPVTAVREREVAPHAAAVLGVGADRLLRRVVELGRAIGPPWGKDQKNAALVAWVALATPRHSKRRAPKPIGS